MTMWIIIMWSALCLTAAALVYVSTRVCRFKQIKKITEENEKKKALIGGGIVLGAFLIIGFLINFMNAIVCVVYFALIWLICDFIFMIIEKIRKVCFSRYYSGGLALIISIAALCFGWYNDHHVWKTEYNLTTTKNIEPLKIALIADSHLGTTFDAEGFKAHLAEIKKQNPDMLIIAGDFVDDGTTREEMFKAADALKEMKNVYFVFGNHDNGYYGPEYRGFSGMDLIWALEQNNVKVLLDEEKEKNGIYIIGRKDFSFEKELGGHRKSMQELTAELDKNKYMIVADHQPADYDNQAQSGVDLVVSGHTHGGQLFPFNQVGKWIGANDRIYGHERRKATDFIVTSGISDWAIKFKTGTKSEYVIINIRKEE
ncbi:MAG: metallophosphoesterase [Alphaproteobacteria bacterium]|nr:metallophosphoesterase [Alphaproteobacteria bacterium]